MAIADRLGRTPAQVLLRWCIQHDVPVIPKSTHRERLEENANIFDFSLSDEDMVELDALDETGGTARASETKWWWPAESPPSRSTVNGHTALPPPLSSPGGCSQRLAVR